VIASAVATWPRSSAPKDFDDQGQVFFPDFTDPLAATALEIVDWDTATRSALPFKVMLENGAWVIPSHSDYPADARDRLARAAGGVITLKRDTIRSDRVEDHADMGVLDPLDPKTTSETGVGKRITLRDQANNTLADLIIGKDIAGREGMRYVRRPGQNRVYGAVVTAEPSSRFADWIETNLLKLDSSRIRSVTFDNHRVDPVAKQIEYNEVFEIERPDASGTWSLEKAGKPAPLPEGKELDSTKISDLVFALSDLKIAGVRPKPPGVQELLDATKDPKEEQAIDVRTVQALARRGFYLVRGELLSNMGAVSAATDEGIVYTLRFGEVTFAEGEALSAGSKAEDEEAKTPEKDKAKESEKGDLASNPSKDAEKKSDGGGVESRYVFVTARFDPELIAKPRETPPPGELPGDVFQRTPAEREAAEKAEKERVEREKTEYQKKLDDGAKKAADLTKRFAPWYYLVPGDAYRKIILEEKSLVRDKGAAPSPPVGGLPPSFPPPGGSGLPGIPHP
jgi:hypothetical protein